MKNAATGRRRRVSRQLPDANAARWAMAAVVVPVALSLSICLGAPVAHAEERTRVDFYDRQWRRTGYAITERGTGRIDFYDTTGRRTGYGRVDPSGRVEQFGLDGKRQGQTAVPALPKAGRR